MTFETFDAVELKRGHNVVSFSLDDYKKDLAAKKFKKPKGEAPLAWGMKLGRHGGKGLHEEVNSRSGDHNGSRLKAPYFGARKPQQTLHGTGNQPGGRVWNLTGMVMMDAGTSASSATVKQEVRSLVIIVAAARHHPGPGVKVISVRTRVPLRTAGTIMVSNLGNGSSTVKVTLA